MLDKRMNNDQALHFLRNCRNWNHNPQLRMEEVLEFLHHSHEKTLGDTSKRQKLLLIILGK
jgi:hypothetical protein